MGSYMSPQKKFTQEQVSKSARVNANIGVSHIDRIVSESPTSLTEWSRHSIIFADAAVHFPNYDLDQFLCRSYYSSFVRVISLFFRSCTLRKIFRASARSSRICRARIQSRLSAYRTRELSRAFFTSRVYLYSLIPVNKSLIDEPCCLQNS